MPEIQVDWAGLEGELAGEVKDALKGLVSGAEEDLRAYGVAIGKDLVRAIREKRPDLITELEHQAQALGEVNRIRVVNATWAQVGNVLAIVGRVAMKAIAAAAVAA